VRGVLAGGAVEEAAALERLLRTAAFFSAGAAPVELRRGSGVFSSLVALCFRAGRPLAGDREVAASAYEDREDFSVLTKLASSSGAQGGGASAPRSVRLPCCLGSPSSPSRAWRSCSGFRRRVVVRVEDDARVREDLVVIFFVSWTFLYESWSI
jgi:hypothetical protein